MNVVVNKVLLHILYREIFPPQLKWNASKNFQVLPIMENPGRQIVQFPLFHFNLISNAFIVGKNSVLTKLDTKNVNHF